jgi:hypothetical protein
LGCIELESASEIRSFLVLARYYRRFIEGFSKIVKPLTTLLEKGKELCGMRSVKLVLRN